MISVQSPPAVIHRREPKLRIKMSMSHAHIGIVTGANKGIGLAIVRQLALRYPRSALSTNHNNQSKSKDSQGLLIYLTARDQARGEAAVKFLYEEDAQLKKVEALKGRRQSEKESEKGWAEVRFHQLDIGDNTSIGRFKEYLGKEHGEIDFVVNNAGIAMEGFDNDVVQKTLECNYYGSLHATQEFLPLIKPTGRLVNMSSIVGKLHRYSDHVRSRFLDAKSVDDISAVMEDFKAAVKANKEKEEGYPSAAYAVSKAGMTGMTKAIALKEQREGGKRLINACCPGYVDTDMSKHRGLKTPDQGAQTPVMLAMEEIGGISGEFWQDEKVIEW